MKVYSLAILMASLLMAGCNTIKGMGQDVESGGEEIQDASDHVKDKM